MSKEIYNLMIKNLIGNSDKQLTLKEIVEKTGVPRTTAHRILKSIDYECAKEYKAWNKGLSKEDNPSLQSASQKLQQRTGWKHSKATKKKISKSMKGNGGIREASGRGNTWDYGEDVLNSDYELKVAQLLDEEGIIWENSNNIIKYNDNGITRLISLGLYLPEYGIYMAVKYHINSDTRQRIRLASQQNDLKVIIVDDMLFRRITYNSIKEILKNSLQSK